jgi:hypothetical protein
LEQQKLVHKVMCIAAHVTGIIGCFALYPPNVLLNTTSEAYSVKHVTLEDIARPQKVRAEVVARKLFEA